MRIKQVQELTGLTKKTIHYYIQEGLIHPSAEQNGYANFSEADVEALTAICRFRTVGFTVKEISDMLTNPDNISFSAIRLTKRLAAEASLAQWKHACMSDIIAQFGDNLSVSQLSTALKACRSSAPEQAEGQENLLDMTDIDFLFKIFLSPFLAGQTMSEYQQYLYDKLRQRIFQAQPDDLIRMKNYLFSCFEESDFSVLRTDHNTHIPRVLQEMGPADLTAYAEELIGKTARRLKQPYFVNLWLRSYDDYIQPMTRFFDENRGLLTEMSPRLSLYQQRVFVVCRYYMDYLDSPRGAVLKQAILKTLKGKIDFAVNNGTQLIYLGEYS